MQSKQRERLSQIRYVLVVGSGKGGVGKSTVSVNLAVALAQRGARVGLLDGDAYGPSVPLMLGVRKRQESRGNQAVLPLVEAKHLPPDRRITPLQRYGVKVMSVGFFIGEEQTVAPMPDVLGIFIRQLLYSVKWEPLDYLIIDLPPGTSEPQATLCREIHLDGAILVTTPQDIARIDTAKALGMFLSAQVPVLGVVRNMDGLLCPHCGERIEIFPQSQERRTLLDDVFLLGHVPLDPVAVRNSDQGYPVVISMVGSPVANAFVSIAEQVAGCLEARRASAGAGESEREQEEGRIEDERED